MPGSVRIRPEQISAVTDSVPEQRRPDRTITTDNRSSHSNPVEYNVNSDVCVPAKQFKCAAAI